MCSYGHPNKARTNEQNQCNFYKTFLTLFFSALGSSSLSHEPVGYSWGRLSYSDGDDRKKSKIKSPKGFQWTPPAPPPLLSYLRPPV